MLSQHSGVDDNVRLDMIIGNKGVKYGLTVPQAKQKGKVPAVKPLNVFGEDEDSGGEPQAVEREIVRQGAKKLADTKVSP